MAEWNPVCEAKTLYGEDGVVTLSEHPSRAFGVLTLINAGGQTVSVRLGYEAWQALSVNWQITVNQSRCKSDCPF